MRGEKVDNPKANYGFSQKIEDGKNTFKGLNFELASSLFFFVRGKC